MNEDDFTALIKTASSHEISTVRDLLEWYNNLDVGPMLQACLKQKEFYYTYELDMYKKHLLYQVWPKILCFNLPR